MELIEFEGEEVGVAEAVTGKGTCVRPPLLGQAQANLPDDAAHATFNPRNLDQEQAHDSADRQVAEQADLFSPANNLAVAALGTAHLMRLRLQVQPQK